MYITYKIKVYFFRCPTNRDLASGSFFFFFDNLGYPGQGSIDMRTSTNPRETRNILLALAPHKRKALP